MALPLELARQAVERYVRAREVIAPPGELPPGLTLRKGAFVTLRIKRELRGCIGTLSPTRANLAEEIIANAISAATADPRFPPLGADELPDLNYEVDIMSPLEPISGEADMDPEQYGVVVQAGWRRGVLLPAIEGVTTADRQLAIARQKAGIAPDQEVRLFRFSVTRFREDCGD